MKKIIVLLCSILFLATGARGQCGIYLSAEDYLSGKLTSESKVLSIPPGPGEDDRVVCGGKTYLWKDIWGYKNNLSEYRMLQGQPCIIACKGNLYALTPYGPFKRVGKKVIYVRKVVGFGEVMVTKDIRDKEVNSVMDFKTLWSYMDPELIPKVKDFFAKCSVENKGVMCLPEQIINYYNSLLPGYIPEPYTEFSVNVYKGD
jgi:hypothetical protein